MKFDPIGFGRHSFAETRIIESKHALAAPNKPISDDMRDMVEDLQRFGQITMRPCAYSLPDGTVVAHPKIYAELMKRLAARADAVHERMAMDAIYGRRGL